MRNPPRVTVLMPVYNAARHLRHAVASILGQTFRDFEFLIIDDGSTDDSLKIIRAFDDARVRLLLNPRNTGLVASLNLGLHEARAPYLARMDADDVSLPTRLQRQVAFMDAHPEVAVCGTAFRVLHKGIPVVKRHPASHNAIAAALFVDTAFAHPSVMLRRSTFQTLGLEYDAGYPHAEDYALWVRTAPHARLANLPHVMLLYRRHATQISHRARVEQRNTVARIRRHLLEALRPDTSDEEATFHDAVISATLPFSQDNLCRAQGWLEALLDRNDRVRMYDPDCFRRVLSMPWFHLWLHSPLGLRASLQGYDSSPRLSYVPRARLLYVKCAIDEKVSAFLSQKADAP